MAPPPYLAAAAAAAALAGDASIMSGIKVEPLIYSPHLFVAGSIGFFLCVCVRVRFDEPGFICMPAAHTHTHARTPAGPRLHVKGHLDLLTIWQDDLQLPRLSFNCSECRRN